MAAKRRSALEGRLKTSGEMVSTALVGSSGSWTF